MPVQVPIYLDNQSTTRVDPVVLDAMLPWFSTDYGNPGSVIHGFGTKAKAAIDDARERVAVAIDARPSEIVFTSGATESNNLAIRGLADRYGKKRNRIVSVLTEHKAVVDPLKRLSRHGFEVIWLDVKPNGDNAAGQILLDQLEQVLSDDTLLVSIMLANNEIGVIQPLERIGALCREHGALLHTDATQAVGKVPVDVRQLNVDLMSFSAHKMYGPKGMGGLYVRSGQPRIRLTSQIDGGGQEGHRRSGTLNVPGIIGLAKAVELGVKQMSTERETVSHLRDRLFEQLQAGIPELSLNGPTLDDHDLRLPGNLNCCFAGIDGEALMLKTEAVACSSGSACTAANPEPSHVLHALGLTDTDVRSSLRFGIGRFNTLEQIDFAVKALRRSVEEIKEIGHARR